MLIDFDKFLDLQRKLPEEYRSKRLAITLPITHYDDDADETAIFSRIIESRRMAELAPLQCELAKRDKVTRKKCTVKGKVLDYDAQTRRYLVEEISDSNQWHYTERLCLQFSDFETKADIDQRRTQDMGLQKMAFLRLNVERMLFSEALKLRPELRPSP